MVFLSKFSLPEIKIIVKHILRFLLGFCVSHDRLLGLKLVKITKWVQSIDPITKENVNGRYKTTKSRNFKKIQTR